ncbi:beta-mannosidase [Streptomyces sp. L-9-10]|nr:beta-mannosidase [Streptomyces sp. L-9-10]
MQVSDDGGTWTDAESVDNSAVPLPFENADASLQRVDIGAREARYVRLSGGERATSWGSSLWSLSVIDSAAPGTDPALRKTATASTEDGDNKAANATDGRSDTHWSSAYEDDQWIQVDLGAAVSFDRVVVVWEPAHPKTYVIQVSDDGDTWTGVKAVDNTPEPLKISVNRVRVFCRGGNWGRDELLRRMSAEPMDTAVRMHRDMNFTMIRNWLGSSNREEFFASCDEYGLLVWNDFPNAWAMDPPDQEAFNSVARDTVLRYRIHPSVVVWCGANEGNPPAAIDTGMREAVQSQAPGILYQNNSAGGIISGGGPYGWVEPERYFSRSTYGGGHFGFHTEIGMPVVSTAESMRNLVGDEPEWPIGDAWYYHDWSTPGESGSAELPRRHRGPSRHGEGSGRLRPQGAVRQLREHPGHVRGVERQPVEGRQRPDALDVPPGLAQHRLADVRLRLRRQRHLLRGAQGLRTVPCAGRPAEVGGHRRQPHRPRPERCDGHSRAPRPVRAPARVHPACEARRRSVDHGHRVHRRVRSGPP